MAPVAGRITDRDKDWPVQLPGTLQCFGSPREPVDRIEGMLQQVGTFLQGQPVRLRLFCIVRRHDDSFQAVGLLSLFTWQQFGTSGDKKIAPRQEGEHGAKVGLERVCLTFDFIIGD